MDERERKAEYARKAFRQNAQKDAQAAVTRDREISDQWHRVKWPKTTEKEQPGKAKKTQSDYKNVYFIVLAYYCSRRVINLEKYGSSKEKMDFERILWYTE